MGAGGGEGVAGGAQRAGRSGRAQRGPGVGLGPHSLPKRFSQTSRKKMEFSQNTACVWWAGCGRGAGGGCGCESDASYAYHEANGEEHEQVEKPLGAAAAARHEPVLVAGRGGGRGESGRPGGRGCHSSG